MADGVVSLEPVFDEEECPELDYRLCGFEGTRLRFRGPAPSLDEPYIAVLGGSETFGKYIKDPYPNLLNSWLDRPVANLGVAQAGLSLFSEEQWLLDAASNADLTIFQVLGAQNMSNRLYSVHARRNDRFLAVSPALREIFPDMDFAEINFTGHLLETMQRASKAGFDVVVEELKWAWVQRMRRIVTTIRSEVMLLWVSDHAPAQTQNNLTEYDPHFVDQEMMNAISGDIAGIIDVRIPRSMSLEGKIVPKRERDAARMVPGPSDHAAIAEAIVGAMARREDGPGLANARPDPEDQIFSISSGTAVKRSATNP